MSPKTYKKLTHVNYDSGSAVIGTQTAAADFREYQTPCSQLHHLALHGSGIASGLEVTASTDRLSLQVAPGVAIDRRGQMIVLATDGSAVLGESEDALDFSQAELKSPIKLPVGGHSGKKVVLTMQFHDKLRSVPPATGEFPAGKLEQTPWLRLISVADFHDSDALVVLAIADIGNDGKVTAFQATAPGVVSTRNPLTSRVAGVQFLASASGTDTVDEKLTGELRAAPDGHGLQVSSDLRVEGKINGRDTGHDGTLLDDLREQVKALQKQVSEMQASLVPVGTIALFGSSTPPPNWLPCNGAVLQVSNFPALAQVLGKKFGGNGVQTFGVPSLADRFPIGAGGSQQVGASGGSATHTLTNAELPPHTHAGTTGKANPVDTLRAVHQVGAEIHILHVVGYAGGGFTDHAPSEVPGGFHQHNFTTSQSPGCVSNPFSILPPFLALHYMIKAK